jgi:hypothetical protein
MESNESPTPSAAPEVKMEMDREALRNLHETGGWAMFLAILGFIMMGFLVLVGLFMGVIFSNLPAENSLPFSGSVFTVFYILIAAVYAIPIYYLFKFAGMVRQGVEQRDSSKVSGSFSYLKSHYKFIGILTIVGIILYILFILLFVALGMGNMLGDTVNT